MKPEGSAMSVLNTVHSQVGDLALKTQRQIIIRLYSDELALQCAGVVAKCCLHVQSITNPEDGVATNCLHLQHT